MLLLYKKRITNPQSAAEVSKTLPEQQEVKTANQNFQFHLLLNPSQLSPPGITNSDNCGTARGGDSVRQIRVTLPCNGTITRHPDILVGEASTHWKCHSYKPQIVARSV